MPPIFDEGQLNLAALQVSDIYVIITPPRTALIQGFPTDGIGLVGTAGWGPLNVPMPVGDVQSAIRAFGNISTSPNDIMTEIIGALKQGARNIFGVRVSDGTDVAASAHFVDSDGSPENLVKLTGIYTGTKGNGIQAAVGVGSNNTAVAASGTITFAVTWTAGDTVTITIGGTAIVYTVVSGDTYTTIAQAVASKINNDAIVGKLVSASVGVTTTTAVVTLTAITRGTIGNAITTVAAETSSTGTAVAGGATLANGTGTQTYKVVLNVAGDINEIFDNLSGTAGVGAGSAALAIVNAINSGISGIRGPSNLVTAAIATTTPGAGTLKVQSTTLSGGTDGRTGVTTNTLLGVDGLVRTGMYALRGRDIAQFGLAGVVDSTSWATQLEYAKSETLLVVLGVPLNKTSSAAVTDKQTAGIDDWHAVFVKDFLYINDTVNNQVRLVSPIGAVLGRMAALSPEQSPGNKPIYGYLGTERTGYPTASGQYQAGAPYSYAELALLESNGVLFMTIPAVGGGYLALRHGQNASSDPTRNGINYSKLTPFLAKSIQKSMGFAVNAVHTPELRRRCKSAVAQFLTTLADPGPGRDPMIGDVNGGPAFSIVCDASNNPDDTVAKGYLFMAVQVKYLSIVRFFVVQIEAGQSVTVRVSNSPLPLAA